MSLSNRRAFEDHFMAKLQPADLAWAVFSALILAVLVTGWTMVK